MLQNIKELYGHKLAATDGEIGHVTDFYFDDNTWVDRYLVADTGSWLSGRKGLLAPHAFGARDREKKTLPISLTCQQTEDSPSIELHKPVSRQYEIEYYAHYGWSIYWGGGDIWGLGGSPEVTPLVTDTAGVSPLYEHRDDKHLQSAKAVQGYAIDAIDGEIGKVSGFLVDERSWAIRYVSADAGHWFNDKEILIPFSDIDRIRYEDSQVFVSLSKAAIRRTEENHVVSSNK